MAILGPIFLHSQGQQPGATKGPFPVRWYNVAANVETLISNVALRELTIKGAVFLYPAETAGR